MNKTSERRANVLVIGGGGREHAIAWALLRSPKVAHVFVSPGNAGTEQMERCSNLALKLDDTASLLNSIQHNGIGLTVVGPEAPLIAGVAEELRHHGHLVVGHDVEIAMLEGDKAFAKQLMVENNIPTAKAVVAKTYANAMQAIEEATLPIVVKASGQALGKGVVICETKEQARTVCVRFMLKKEFGEEGTTVLIEEFLQGTERSLIVAMDRSGYRSFIPAQDHKRALDGDKGPNTGGMGAYAPTETDWVSEALSSIVEPMHSHICQMNAVCSGFLYVGLMITKEGPKVLEFNVRLGDPEAEAILPLLNSDFYEMCVAMATGTLSLMPTLEWEDRYAVVVVMASQGYPGEYEKGKPISLPENDHDDMIVFHAGTKQVEEQIVTSGGRVLDVVGIGNDLTTATQNAYKGVKDCNFDGASYRKDIPVLAK